MPIIHMTIKSNPIKRYKSFSVNKRHQNWTLLHPLHTTQAKPTAANNIYLNNTNNTSMPIIHMPDNSTPIKRNEWIADNASPKYHISKQRQTSTLQQPPHTSQPESTTANIIYLKNIHNTSMPIIHMTDNSTPIKRKE